MMISIQGMPPFALAYPIALAIAAPMNAAMMPMMMVSQIGMACLPGTTRRPSAPMMSPMMIAEMMPVMVISLPSHWMPCPYDVPRSLDFPPHIAMRVVARVSLHGCCRTPGRAAARRHGSRAATAEGYIPRPHPTARSADRADPLAPTGVRNTTRSRPAHIRAGQRAKQTDRLLAVCGSPNRYQARIEEQHLRKVPEELSEILRSMVWQVQNAGNLIVRVALPVRAITHKTINLGVL